MDRRLIKESAIIDLEFRDRKLIKKFEIMVL